LVPIYRTRPLAAGRLISSDTQQARLLQISNQLKLQNQKINKIERSLKKIEHQLSNSTTDAKIPTFASKRIFIEDMSFNAGKITDVRYRKSYFYITYPYVVTFKYKKKSVGAIIENQYATAPITHDFEHHKFCRRLESEAEELYRQIIKKCPHLKAKD